MAAERLLSIVVPTRNRSEYAIPTIAALLGMCVDSIEIVVEDNSTDASLSEWAAHFERDGHLRYSWSREPRSMTENYERAIGRARGEYVSVIGDDDGVSPEIVEAVIWARTHGIEALVPDGVAQYVWPDLVMPAPHALGAGELRLRSFTGAIRSADAEVELRRCVASAAQSFHGLPKIYYGIVRRRCLELVQQRAGCFFPGISPDIAGAIALATTISTVVHINYPLFVPGSSLRSNAGLSGLRKHVGLLREQSHLPFDCEERWSNAVPPFYSVETVWAEAAMSALRALGRQDLVPYFDVPQLYAECLMWHPEYASLILKQLPKSLRAVGMGGVAGVSKLVARYAALGARRARALLSRARDATPPATDETKLAGLSNVGAAVEAMLHLHAERGISFAGVVGTQNFSREAAGPAAECGRQGSL